MSKKNNKPEFVEPERTIRAREWCENAKKKGEEHDISIAVDTMMAPHPSPESARNLLGRFCDSIEAGEWPDKLIMYYLADSFVEILNGKPADKALGLIAKNSRPSENVARNIDIAFAVYDMLEAGEKQAYVFAKVAEQFDLKPDTIKGIWKNHKGSVSRE